MAVERLSARELILTLMDSAVSGTLSVSYLVAAGQIFDMDAGSVRVALARLVKEGSLVAMERGLYGLGSRSGTLHRLVRNWSRAEEALTPWAGGWLSMLLGHLARSNKTRVRANVRALRLYGFAEAHPGLWLRPANLRPSLEDIRAALIQLGLDGECVAARVDAFEPTDTVGPESLWDIARLERRYVEHLATLAESHARLGSLSEPAAARETLLVGRQVTRDILLDPLLPDELVNGNLRREMVAAMRDYDRIGKAYWRTFFQRHEAGQNPAA
jgi:phenylacetic acid degradation operon negative regulatory protein